MKNSCPDCGAAPVIHNVEQLSVIVDWLLSPFQKPAEFVWKKLAPLYFALRPERFTIRFIHILAKVGLGTILYEPDDKVNLRGLCLWEEAKRRGITMYEFRLFNLPRDIFVASFRGKSRLFDGLPRPGFFRPSSLDWVDNKGVMRKKFIREGIPVARGAVCFRLKHALNIFQEIGGAVITKPNVGSRSRHTTMHITTPERLIEAFKKSKQLSPWVIVEEELQGMVFRATMIAGKVVGVARREPAAVYGDGKSTIRELVEKENSRPERKGPIFHEIHIDQDAEKELTRQSLTWESVPSSGRFVTLGVKTSRGAAGSTTDFTDVAHPQNLELFENVARLLNDSIVGLDFIIEDMTKSWQSQKKCGVIECNSLPFIDVNQYPLFGKSRNVAGAIWELAFPELPREKV